MRRLADWAQQNAWPLLIASTVVTAALYVALLAMGPEYALAKPQAQRPILVIVALYAAAFAPYWVAWWLAVRVSADTRLVWWLLVTSLVWRGLLLPTPPFQEIDIYRYVWDGAVARHGWDPYRYPPKDVVQAIDGLQAEPGRAIAPHAALAERVNLAVVQSPEYEDVLRTIHYADLTSPYPPVSQAVFAIASATSPFSAATGHVAWLKLWLTAFDIATLLVVVWLLQMTGLHFGHAIAYGWCPLVIKEIAGSGHLDSIATFFAVLALAFTIRLISSPQRQRQWTVLSASAGMIGLGVGAKLFPIVLAPLLALVWLRRVGWGAALSGCFLVVLSSVVLLAPMFLRGEKHPPTENAAAEDGPLTPPPDAASQQNTAGLAVFLTRWEMNDLIFAVVVENFRAQENIRPSERPWFVAVPDSVSAEALKSWRTVLDRLGFKGADLPDGQASFLLARTITVVAFAVVALCLAWRASGRESSGADVAEAAFLTLAWFWLLAPTQNPWYWCWALPLLPFARSRSWALLAACSLLYYLRFWLLYHYKEPGVFGTPYDGPYFFYFVVTWIEFGPWLLLLSIETLARQLGRPAADR